MTDHIIETDENIDIEVVDLGVASEETQGALPFNQEEGNSRP